MTKLNIKIYADGADINEMQRTLDGGLVTGFTTNPSLMKAAGIKHYQDFANEALNKFPNHPISFEIFADDLDSMEREARILAQLGENVYVKIPVTNSKGETTGPLIKKLSGEGVKLNVTAIFTLNQVKDVVTNLTDGVPSVVSVFAGRIADTGVDPIPLMKDSLEVCRSIKECELLWASPREVLNVYQANDIGVDIITCTPGIIDKLSLNGKDLDEYSLETVQMFLNDSKQLGFGIE